jgi:hypothetical protein
VPLTRTQNRLRAEIEQIASMSGMDHWNILQFDKEGRTTRLQLIKNQLVRGHVITAYTYIDELLSFIICAAYFKRPNRDMIYTQQWRTKKFQAFAHHLKSDGFFHDAKRNPCMLVVSWRLAMNFAREPFFAAPRRKSGNRRRSALATTNSDGGMPGRTVRSHDPNESHTIP